MPVGVRTTANVRRPPGQRRSNSRPLPSKTKVTRTPSPSWIAVSDRSKLAHAAGRLCANITRNSGHAWTMFDPSTKRCRSLAINQTYDPDPIAQTRIGKNAK
jgi:hypothetical protein